MTYQNIVIRPHTRLTKEKPKVFLNNGNIIQCEKVYEIIIKGKNVEVLVGVAKNKKIYHLTNDKSLDKSKYKKSGINFVSKGAFHPIEELSIIQKKFYEQLSDFNFYVYEDFINHSDYMIESIEDYQKMLLNVYLIWFFSVHMKDEINADLSS